MDPRNTGQWDACVEMTDIDLPDNWTIDSYIGLSASTGQLSGMSSPLSAFSLLFFLFSFLPSFCPP
jgi:hypothetical protein